MRMGQGVRTGLGHGGITCVLQTQFSSLTIRWDFPVSRMAPNNLINPMKFCYNFWDCFGRKKTA